MTLAWQQPALLAATVADEAAADSLARRLGLGQVPTGSDPALCPGGSILLVVRDGTLCLQQAGRGAPGPVAVDFGSGTLRYRQRDNTPELLGRAVGRAQKRSLTILDATAGLGTDAFVLAGLGHEVLMCERDPVVVELLRNGLDRARGREDERLAEVLGRLSLQAMDARECDGRRLGEVDVIYLDPMFPGRAKSAAVRKEMALLQRLLRDVPADRDADDLLRWALRQDVARVVVKRPVKAASLGSQQPSHSIRGKAVRYDVYVRRKPRQRADAQRVSTG